MHRNADRDTAKHKQTERDTESQREMGGRAGCCRKLGEMDQGGVGLNWGDGKLAGEDCKLRGVGVRATVPSGGVAP